MREIAVLVGGGSGRHGPGRPPPDDSNVKKWQDESGIWHYGDARPAAPDAATNSAADAYRRGDYATAFREYLNWAKQGDPRAQTMIGLMYLRGEGVGQSLSAAPSTGSGARPCRATPTPSTSWGCCMPPIPARRPARRKRCCGCASRPSAATPRRSTPWPASTRPARAWRGMMGKPPTGYQQAAQQGIPPPSSSWGISTPAAAACRVTTRRRCSGTSKRPSRVTPAHSSALGAMYGGRPRVAASDQDAAQWYRKAAEQGHAEAQYNLAVRFLSGRGVARSDEEAFRWFRKAADQGLDWPS